MAQQVVDRLVQRFGAAITAHSDAAAPAAPGAHAHAHAHLGTGGNDWATVDPAHLLLVAAFLRDEPDLALQMPIDCTVVDYLGHRTPRFEVLWHLYSVRHRHRVRLRVYPGDAAPEAPSLTPLWPGFNWFEREAWDLYGVRFTGHPNLCRLLMYEEFVGHPLRKDYPIDKRQPLTPQRHVRPVPTQRHAPPELLNRP